MTTKQRHTGRGKLKHVLDGAAVRGLAGNLSLSAGGRFDRRSFLAATVPSLGRLELFDRADLIARQLRRHLSLEFGESTELLVGTLGPARTTGGYGPPSAFKVLPLTRFVSAHGLKHPEVSLEALREMTRRFTAEFDVRPFIRLHPELCQEVFRKWVRDDDQHVRRLVSEGMRPRLPWASHLRRFKRDPLPVLELLEELKDDSSAYVRRSVANNLADILKDNPEIGQATVARWSRSLSPPRRWMLRHATRYWRRREETWALELDRSLAVQG